MNRSASYVVYKYDLHSPCGHLVSSPVGGNFTQNVPGEHNIRITAVENTICLVCTGIEEKFFLSDLLNKLESGRKSRLYKMINRCPEKAHHISKLQFLDAKAISNWDRDISHIKGIIEGIKNQADSPIPSEVIQADFDSERRYFMRLREEKHENVAKVDEQYRKTFFKEYFLYNDVKFVNDILANVHGVYIGRQWALKAVQMGNVVLTMTPNNDFHAFTLCTQCGALDEAEEEYLVVDDHRNVHVRLLESSETCRCCQVPDSIGAVKLEDLLQQCESCREQCQDIFQSGIHEEDKRTAKTAMGCWSQDIEFLRGVMAGYVDQEKHTVHEIIRGNHLHNAERHYENRVSDSSISSAEKQRVEAEWTFAQGQYLGRRWLDRYLSQNHLKSTSLALNTPDPSPRRKGRSTRERSSVESHYAGIGKVTYLRYYGSVREM